MIDIYKGKAVAVVMSIFTLAGCMDGSQSAVTRSVNGPLSPLQACAVGFDMSRQIYERVKLSETVVVPARKPTACEHYTLDYLRRAGFLIDESANVAPLEIVLTPDGRGQIYAVASVSGQLRLARMYQLAPEGVYPKSGVSFLEIPRGAMLSPQRRVSRTEAPIERGGR